MRHLDQVKRLLSFAEDKPFGLAIWIQLYLGLRIGELQALKWCDIDFESGFVSIRRTFVRKTNLLRDYPKGGKQHSVALPPELQKKLVEEKQFSLSDYVVVSHTGTMLQYKSYLKTLKQYCEAINVPVLGTYGLRHSTWELYRMHGATREDMRRLFAHSSERVTERYLHSEGENVQHIAKTIQLFSKTADKISENFETRSKTDKTRTKTETKEIYEKRRCA